MGGTKGGITTKDGSYGGHYQGEGARAGARAWKKGCWLGLGLTWLPPTHLLGILLP